MSGYVVKIMAFVPCAKSSEAHIEAFNKFRHAVIELRKIGFLELELSNEFKPNRKTAQPEEGAPPVDASPPAC